jgi:hypothetical protein
MAKQDGKPANAGRKSSKLNYFYLDGQLDGKTVPLLHKSLNINRGADKIITWCYPLEKRVAYTYSDLKKRKEPAFTLQETATMLNRGRVSLERAIMSGSITRPQYTYGLNEHKRLFKYMFHESNIMEAHAYFSSVHYGPPRKDGFIVPKRLPTARELRAMIRQEQILYVINDDGEFVPVWRAENFD